MSQFDFQVRDRAEAEWCGFDMDPLDVASPAPVVLEPEPYEPEWVGERRCTYRILRPGQAPERCKNGTNGGKARCSVHEGQL